MDIKEIRTKTNKEIKDEILKIKKNLAVLRQSLLEGKSNKTTEITSGRKDIAKLSTVLREKQILEEIQ